MATDTKSNPTRALGLVSTAILVIAACSAGATRQGTTGASSTSTGHGTTTSTSAATTSSGKPGDDCSMLCATEAKVPCDGGAGAAMDCISACEFAKTEVTWCTPEATAATDCLAKEPESSFACTAGAVAAVSGVCTTELAANQGCWYDGPPGGLPDLTADCTAVCQSKSALSCADPNCVSGCEAAVKAGQKCNGAFAALVACAAKLPPSDFACDTETPPQANLKEGLCPFEGLLLYACLKG